MTKLSRRDVLAFAAASVFPVASPALADAPAPFTVNEIVDDGNRFFGTLSRALADVVQKRRAVGDYPTHIFSAKRPLAHSWPVYDTAKAKCIRGTPATSRCFGKAHRSALMPALTGTGR